MENRFGLRDLIYCGLIVAVIVVLLLSQCQVDRFNDRVGNIENQLTGQSSDLAKIRQLMEQGGGVALAPGNGGQTGDAVAVRVDPFERRKRAKDADDFASGDYLVDTFAVVPDKLTPLLSTDVYGSMIQGHVMETLATRDPVTLEYVPLLATGWTISDDGLRIEFDLRRGVTYSDGEPFNADDVVFSFNWIMNPEVEAERARVYYEKLEGVEKLDDYKVAFIFSEPYFKAFEVAASMDLLSDSFYGAYTPSAFNREVGLLIGTGPYRLADPKTWRPEPGKPLEVIRNERYWGEPPAFDKLVWQVIGDETARLTTFTNGDIDTLPCTPEQYETLKKDESVMSRTANFAYQRPNAGYRYVAWNQKIRGEDTLFADKRVRQAMAMLTDRQRFIDEIMLGYGIVVSGPFGPLTPQSNKDVTPWPFDPERAKALLKEVGWEDRDGDGVIENAAGKPLQFELNYPSGSLTYERLVLLMKDMYARAGVVLTPKPVEWNVLLEKLDNRDFQAISLGWSGNIESDPYQIFHSSQAKQGGDNYISFSNAEFDATIDKARVTMDEDARMALWHRAHELLHEDQPYMFMYTGQSLIFLDDRIQNVERVSLGLNPSDEWYVPSAEQKWVK